MLKEYHLKADEANLFEAEVLVEGKQKDSELLLTNLNLVLVTRTKKLFSKEEMTTDIYPMNELKMYEGKPQIKQKGGKKVQLFFHQRYH